MKTVSKKYDLGHTSESDYQREPDLYCPNCGKQSVWGEAHEGDYYCGPEYACADCAYVFTMPTSGEDKEVAEQLKE